VFFHKRDSSKTSVTKALKEWSHMPKAYAKREETT